MGKKNKITKEDNRYVQQLSILTELPFIWRSSKSFDELLCATVELIDERLRFWDLSFFRYLPEDEILKRIADVGGLSELIPRDYEQSINEGVIGWVVRNRKTKYVPDIRSEKIFIPVPGGNTLSELAVPVYSGKTIFGVINMESRQIDDFDEIDRLTMEAVAQNLALYLEYMQHLEKEKTKVENLEIINRLNLFFNSTLNVADLENNICDKLYENLDVYYISYYKYETENQKIKKISSAGGSKNQRSMASDWPADKGILGLVVKNKQALYVDDIAKHPEYLSISNSDVGSEYCLPVIFGKQVYGLINIESCEMAAFDENQLVILQTITDHFSRTLRNAILFEQINREKEKSAAILSQMNDGVVIMDNADRLIYANQTAVKLLPTFGKKGLHFVPDCAIFQDVRKNLGINKQQVTYEQENDEKVWLINAIRMRQTQNILILIEDITAKKRKESEKIEKERMQTAVELAGSVAHEINQPLTGILGYCALLLEDEGLRPDIAEDIHTIEEQAQRISHLVKKLQNLVAIKTKTYLRKTDIVDLEKSGDIKE